MIKRKHTEHWPFRQLQHMAEWLVCEPSWRDTSLSPAMARFPRLTLTTLALALSQISILKEIAYLRVFGFISHSKTGGAEQREDVHFLILYLWLLEFLIPLI